MNKVILIGNVGRDPERRGGKVISFSLATSEGGYTRADGTKVEDRTEWHSVTVFDTRMSAFVEKYVRKGSRLIIEGRIHYSEYTDRDGNKRQGVEIIASSISFDQTRNRENMQSGDLGELQESE